MNVIDLYNSFCNCIWYLFQGMRHQADISYKQKKNTCKKCVGKFSIQLIQLST